MQPQHDWPFLPHLSLLGYRRPDVDKEAVLTIVPRTSLRLLHMECFLRADASELGGIVWSIIGATVLVGFG